MYSIVTPEPEGARMHGVPPSKQYRLHIKELRNNGAIDKVIADAVSRANGKPGLLIKSLHLSCSSDKFTGKDMAGMVLWAYKGSQHWNLNGRHYQSGYVYIKDMVNIQSLQTAQGQVHGKLYRSLFGCDPDGSVTATGFAYKAGVWRWNSGTFNANAADGYHYDDDSAASAEEMKLIKKVVELQPGATVSLASQ
eukprot:CAMPEP_0171217034 /NCGR_PEP_ID=MMETSP0790-20130122/32482_1 /TAXON_ID=2925 /ORGANISM="Alexandrium catenella, Strain OF101" /LENGTH=193 /DNA_ID=CAMNT_0011682821 /DNA_START=163 /DNA_END=744 /DNA_ORIENTATION=-